MERHSDCLEIKAIIFYSDLFLSQTKPVSMGLQHCYGDLRGSEVFTQYEIKTPPPSVNTVFIKYISSRIFSFREKKGHQVLGQETLGSIPLTEGSLLTI